jgi:hypothetical protein
LNISPAFLESVALFSAGHCAALTMQGIVAVTSSLCFIYLFLKYVLILDIKG